MTQKRVLSGMRPTGALHIGHYQGALKNWLRLQAAQDQYQCFYFVADWHALTTHYQSPEVIEASMLDMVTDWLACGLNPEQSTIFVQSWLPQHAELFVLLSMGTPLTWLERVPTYKDQMQKLADRELSTYGFLGYPLLQAADILMYRAHYVPVGEDQAPHVEFTRETARRFNHLYGQYAKADMQVLLNRLPANALERLQQLRTRHQEQGDPQAQAQGEALVAELVGLGPDDRQALLAYLLGKPRQVLVEPEVLLTEAMRLPGLDGQKMSKSYGNTIMLREEPQPIRDKIKRMPTDPQRVRRSDAGDPNRCPVYEFHKVYSDATTRDWVVQGCTSAGIGCIECKAKVAEAIIEFHAPIRERVAQYQAKPQWVKEILRTGTQRARSVAEATMHDVRSVMGLKDEAS